MPKKRLVRNLFLIIGGFVLLLIILAEIFKNDIVKMALTKGANTFDVPLAVGEVDFSLLYHFPLATIEFNDLVMLNKYTEELLVQEQVDTVASISKLYAAVDIVELIRGNILVKKIEIENANVKYLVDSLGASNFDFLLKAPEKDSLNIEEADTTVVQGVYALEELTLSNIDMVYVDDYMNFAGHLLIPELTVNGEFASGGYAAETDGELVIQSVHYEDFYLEELKHSSLTFNVTALNDTIKVDEMQLNAAGSVIDASGLIVQGDSIYADINFSGKEIDIAKHVALLPQKILKEYKLNKIGGILALSGTSKGYITPNSVPQFNIDASIKDGLVYYDVYPEVNNVSLSVNVSSGYATGLDAATVNVKQFHAQTAQSNIDLSAMIQNFEKLQYDLVLDVKTNLSELKPFVPDSLVKSMSGIVKAKLSTSGILPDSITEEFTEYALNRTQLDIALNDLHVEKDSIPAIRGLSGDFSYRPGKLNVHDFKVVIPDYKINIIDGYVQSSYKGKLSDYKHLFITLDSVFVAMPQSSLSAAGTIKGLEKVQYNLQSSVVLGLDEVKEMIPDSLVHFMAGKIVAHAKSAGDFHIDSVADQAMSLLFEKSSFGVDLSGVTLEMPDTLMNVTSLTGNVSYCADTLWVNNMTGNYLGLDFGADSTSIANIYTAAIQNNEKQLFVHGNFSAGDLDYAWVESFMVDTVPMSEEERLAALKKAQDEEPYVQKYTTKVNGKAKLKSFKYGDVFVQNIDTKFLAKLEEEYFVADELYCNIFDGDVNASVKYEMNVKDEKSKLKNSFVDVMYFKADGKQLDMSRLMDELEVYIDQEDFKKDNVLGRLTAQIDGKIVLKEYEPVYEEMMLKGDVKLENGALVNVQPVMDIEEISVIKLNNMDKLYFSTLESSFFLFKNKMYFPRTDIKSSSFDAMFFGMYSFGEDYAYHLKMYLNQLLSKSDNDALNKASKDNGFSEEDVKDGKRPVYVVSKSIDGKSKAGLDNRKDRVRMDAKVNLQKQMVDMNFHPKLVKYSTED
jgi:hypothetical protein